MPRYKKYSSKGNEPATLINFNMVCHGLSQNTKTFQLNSYRDVIRGQPFSEICDNIAVKMLFEPYAVYRYEQFEWKDGRMNLLDIPYPKYLKLNQMVLDSEMVQTFVDHNHISHVEILEHSWWWEYGWGLPSKDMDYHFEVGSMALSPGSKRTRFLTPSNNLPWTIFIKEGLEIIRFRELYKVRKKIVWKWAAVIWLRFCLFKYVGIGRHPDHLQKKQKQFENPQA